MKGFKFEMKKPVCIFLLLILVLLLPTTAQGSWQGIDAWAGKDWQALQEEIKSAFLQGMIEGLKFVGQPIGPFELEAEKIQDYIPGLDRLYEDPENSEIPIVLMLDYVNSELVGMDQEELDFRLKKLREIARIN